MKTTSEGRTASLGSRTKGSPLLGSHGVNCCSADGLANLGMWRPVRESGAPALPRSRARFRCHLSRVAGGNVGELGTNVSPAASTEVYWSRAAYGVAKLSSVPSPREAVTLSGRVPTGWPVPVSPVGLTFRDTGVYMW